MLARHRYEYIGNTVSTRGIEAYLYNCNRCAHRRNLRDALPVDEISRVYKNPPCVYRAFSSRQIP